MMSSPFALVAMTGFPSFHFCFAPDKRTFCHSSLDTLYPAPLLPLDDNNSIAWSVRIPVLYIKPNTWPSKLQSSLLGYFPGYTRLPLVIPTCPVITSSPHSASFSQSPHPASAPAVFIDSQLHHLNSTTLSSPATCGALDLICPPCHRTSSFPVRPLVG